MVATKSGLLDVDTAEVVALLRAALSESGLSQGGFACALGTSGPRFSTYLSGTTRPSGYICMKARRLGLALGAARAAGLMSAPVTAATVGTHLRDREPEWAWRMLLQGRDHLRLMLTTGEEARVASWEAMPGSTGSREFDTLLAALAAREFENHQRSGPAWTQVEALSEPWATEHPFLSAERVIQQTPSWLRELNIYLPARDLVTA